MTIIQAVFLSYVIGSIVTMFLVKKHFVMVGIESTVDMLIDDGYLKHRKQGDEIILIKHNDEEESSS